MANNCLVTKLKSVVDNSNLDILGCLKLHVRARDVEDYNDLLRIEIDDKSQSAPVIKGIGNTFFVNNVEYSEYTMEPQLYNDFYRTDIRVKNADYDILIDGNAPYRIRSLDNRVDNSKRNYPWLLKADISKLNYSPVNTLRIGSNTTDAAKGSFYPVDCSNILLILLRGEEVIEDINYFAGKTNNVANVEIQLGDSQNISGDISSFAGFLGLQALRLEKTKVSGTVESLAQSMKAAGRTSGSLRIEARNTNVKWNGSAITSALMITFNGDDDPTIAVA